MLARSFDETRLKWKRVLQTNRPCEFGTYHIYLRTPPFNVRADVSRRDKSFFFYSYVCIRASKALASLRICAGSQ